MFILLKYFPRVFWFLMKFFLPMLVTLYFSSLIPNICFFPPGRASLQNCPKLKRHFCLHLMVRELLSVCIWGSVGLYLCKSHAHDLSPVEDNV